MGRMRDRKNWKELLRSHHREAFARRYMELVNSGTTPKDIAKEMSRGPFFRQQEVGVAWLEDVVKQMYHLCEGGPAFIAWYEARQNRPHSDRTSAALGEVAKSDSATLLLRIQQLEVENRSLIDQARRRDEQHEKALKNSGQSTEERVRREFADEQHRLRGELSDSVNRRQSLERELKNERDRVEILKRRPVVDAKRLDELTESNRSLRAENERLTHANKELEDLLADKQTALAGAHAKLQAVQPVKPIPLRRVPDPPPSERVFDHLDALVTEGVMTAEEAFERMRRAK